jgi:MipA family protein
MASVSGRVAIAVVLLFTPGLAAAADLAVPPPATAPQPPATYAPAAAPDWIVTIGGEVRAVPAWPGAPTSLYGITGIPLFSIRKPGDPPFFFGARDGFGIPILDFGQIQIGPVGKLLWPRYSSQYSQLNGLGDISWTLQLGGYAAYWPTPWLRLRGEVRQGIGGETGVTGDLFADVIVPVGQFRFSAGPRVTAQSGSAVSPYFSITAAQSAASGLPTYTAAGGFYSYGAGGQVEYFWSPQWQTHALVEFERISGSAADSPLVTMRGSANQLTFGLGATYTFGMHPLFNMHSLW